MIQKQIFLGDSHSKFIQELEILEQKVPKHILQIIRDKKINLVVVPEINLQLSPNTPAYASINENLIKICEPSNLERKFGYNLEERVAIFLHEIGHILNNPEPELMNRDDAVITSPEIYKEITLKNFIKKMNLKREINICSIEEYYADYFAVIANFKIPLLSGFEKYLKNIESSDTNLFVLRKNELYSNKEFLTNELKRRLNNN